MFILAIYYVIYYFRWTIERLNDGESDYDRKATDAISILVEDIK